MGSKKSGRKRQHTAGEDVCAGGLEHGAASACPPVEGRSDNGNVVDSSMGYGDLGLAGVEAVALDQRHQLRGSGHDGRDGEGNGEDGEVVAEEGKQLGGEFDVKSLVNGGHSRRRGWILVEEVKSIQTTGQEGRGDGKVDECWVGWKRHV